MSFIHPDFVIGHLHTISHKHSDGLFDEHTLLNNKHAYAILVYYGLKKKVHDLEALYTLYSHLTKNHD